MIEIPVPVPPIQQPHRAPQGQLILLSRRYKPAHRTGSVYVVFIPMRNATFFECFPYVCPEPVLVKRSFFSIKWYKNGVSDLSALAINSLCGTKRTLSSTAFFYIRPKPVLANARVLCEIVDKKVTGSYQISDHEMLS